MEGHPDGDCNPCALLSIAKRFFPILIGFLQRGDSHSERMDFQGWGRSVGSLLIKRNNNIENDNKNTPGLRFIFSGIPMIG